MDRITLSVAMAALSLAACGSETENRSELPVEPTYEVTFDAETAGRIRVEARLPDPWTELTMSERGAGMLPDGWAHFVDDLRVVTADGEEIAVTKDEGRSWGRAADAAAGVGPAILTYDVHLAHDTLSWPGGVDGAAMQLPWGAYFAGRAVFVVPEGYEGPVRVRLRTSPGWDVAAPWPEAEDETVEDEAGGSGEPGAGREFVAPTVAALTESYAFIGDFEGFVVDRGGSELAFALGGPSVVERREHFEALAEEAFDYFIALMGDSPRPAPDVAMSRVMVLINEADVTDGEVIGNHINILLARNPDPFGKIFSTFGFVHELFHLWNGKSIRPAGPDDWFTEGLTNYYALKAVHQAGTLPEEQFYLLLENMLFARYVSDPGYGTLSLREAVEDKDGHWGLVYGGGMFAGICLDAAIRDASGDEASLDDVMRDMFERFGGSTNEFGLDDVADSVRRHGGYDPGPFLDRHVRGAEPIPVAECLADFGLDAVVEDGRLRVSRPASDDGSSAERIAGLLGRLTPAGAATE